MIKYLKSKTVWAGILLAIIPIANAYFEVVMEPAIYAAYSVACSYVMIYLRSITTQPLSAKVNKDKDTPADYYGC